MAYKVKVDGATIPKQVGVKVNKVPRVVRANDGPVDVPVYRTSVYLAGDVIEDDDVAPIVIEQYDNGDEHIRSLIERVGVSSEKKAAKKSSSKKSK